MSKPCLKRIAVQFLSFTVLLTGLTACRATDSESSTELNQTIDTVLDSESFQADNTYSESNPDRETGFDLADEPETMKVAVPRLQFSHDSGVYPEETLTVKLAAPEGYTVAFKTDGTFPTSIDDTGNPVVEVELSKNTARYLAENRKLQIMKDFSASELRDNPELPAGAMLCAALVDNEGIVGAAESKVYFLGLDFQELYPNCLVLSIITDPTNLLDYDIGILATGTVYDVWRETVEGKKVIKKQELWNAESNSTQHGRNWERPCIIQIYDGEKTPAVEQAAGIRTQGRLARRVNQKSFNLYFRSDYGKKHMNYELFPGIREYKNFSLRSGGNNSDRLKFKNAMLQELVSDRAVLIESFRPAVLFLNAEYWGPYMICEKVSAQMIHDHYGVDTDQVVVIKEGEVEVGKDKDLQAYEELMSFAEQDLTQPEAYERFCSVVNVESFADYCAIRIYIGDADWNPQKNDMMWRTRDASFQDGRWQFILHDIGFSSGIYSDSRVSPRKDHYHSAMNQYPLFAAAIRNHEFYSLFLKSLAEIGGENYSYDNVEASIHVYDDMWRPMMKDYYKRFGSPSSYYDSEMKNTLEFFKQRYDYIVPLVQEH